ncbi:D-alanyl-D-alanine carboxypeptidase [Agreia sp. VKM Ac-1783]|uniref:D-alanyl-D-alanine carboxypeptidase family protein n=1 Tax=Agreia sp. VKM Ac-1783 TaxID=1938889 RepID=UPI000A2AD079|nr:D-alanyl-D-alanine carboxypeptidase [Agreia sp. VKM Ac-1783]SMQ67575.1 D-alanyl-D-alanine carboxypeptidase (penicillin-binding protein 5/6) [Agreia sp. VKM Ac-1783]
MRPPSAPVRRRRRIVAFSAGGILVAMAATLGLYVPAALAAPLPTAQLQLAVPTPTPAQPAKLALPGVGTGAIALEGSEELLGESGQTGPVPIASVTKVITALVVLEAHPLVEGDDGPGITMTAADVQILEQTRAVDGSYELVNEGQVLSEREVLEIMLLKSANNYAETVTNWAFGSLAAYLDAARSFTTEHGLTDTTIVDASGLNPGSRSSTKDLMRIASMALADPVLATIVSTAVDQVPVIGEIDNSNKLLGIDGIDGIKTGTTDEAGSCLLFSAEFTVGDQTKSVVGVILGAESSQAARDAVQALLASTKGAFTTLPLIRADTEVGSYTTAWGETAPIVAASDSDAVVWSDDGVDVDASAADVVTTQAGINVGTIRYTVDDTTEQVALTVDGSLEDPGFWWRVGHPELVFG